MSSAENDLPRGPVRLIDPFGAGGGPDLIARAMAPALEERWRQPVSVENHPGAGSTDGPALVASARPDGRTLLVNTSAHAYGAAFPAGRPYDPLADFTPIASLTSQPYVLVAGTGAGFSTLAELVAAATAHPDTIRFGSSGTGTGTHLGIEQLDRDLGIRTIHIPSVGTDAIADTIGHTVEGQTEYSMSPISIALPHILERRLVPLGVTTATRRSRILPEVPTLAEAGAPGFDFPIWYGVWAPAGIPAHMAERLANDIHDVLTEPVMRAWISDHDGDPLTLSTAAFSEFVLAESERARMLVDRED